MIRDHEYMEKLFEKKYPGYKFIDAEIKLNGINDSYYIYARMCRNWNGRNYIISNAQGLLQRMYFQQHKPGMLHKRIVQRK